MTITSRTFFESFIPTTAVSVRPGDLITAELMNQMLQRIAALEGHFATQLLTVPNVLGRPFPVAAQTMNAAGLRVGTVIDVAGKQVQAGDAGAGKRVVVATQPGPGDSVALNRDVAFLLTVPVEKTGPDIASLLPPQVTVGAPLTILGQHFTQATEVLFDGVRIDNAVILNPEMIRIDPVPPFTKLTLGSGFSTFDLPNQDFTLFTINRSDIEPGSFEAANLSADATARRAVDVSEATAPPPRPFLQTVTITVKTADGIDTLEAPFAGTVAARPFITNLRLSPDRRSFTLLGGSFGGNLVAQPEVFVDQTPVNVVRVSPTVLTLTGLPKKVTDLMDDIVGWALLLQKDQAGELQPQLKHSMRFGEKLTKVLLDIPLLPQIDPGIEPVAAAATLRTALNTQNVAVAEPESVDQDEIPIVVQIGKQLISEVFIVLFRKLK